MTMKPRRLLPMILILSLVLLAGCASGGPEAATVDPHAAAETILETVEFRDSLLKADGGVAENYYRLDGIADYAIYISGSGATAEEIAVLKVADSTSLEDARAILERRVEDLIFQFDGYVPGELVKLEEPVIITKGDIAVLVTADDYSAAKKAVDELF